MFSWLSSRNHSNTGSSSITRQRSGSQTQRSGSQASITQSHVNQSSGNNGNTGFGNSFSNFFLPGKDTSRQRTTLVSGNGLPSFTIDDLIKVNGILNSFERCKEDELIECLRKCIEILIYSDQSKHLEQRELIFEYFCTQHMLEKFIRINKSKTAYLSVRIQIQLLQSISILFQNIQRSTSLYYLLSNNHINELIRSKNYRIELEEVRDCFPLYHEALPFLACSENMIRIAIRTLLLNMYGIVDAPLRTYLKHPVNLTYIYQFILSGKDMISRMQHTLNLLPGSHKRAPDRSTTSPSSPASPAPQQIVQDRFQGILDEFFDYLYFIQDILKHGLTDLNYVLCEFYFTNIIQDCILHNFLPLCANHISNPTDRPPYVPLLPRRMSLKVEPMPFIYPSTTLSLWLLTLNVQIGMYTPLLNAICFQMFHVDAPIACSYANASIGAMPSISTRNTPRSSTIAKEVMAVPSGSASKDEMNKMFSFESVDRIDEVNLQVPSSMTHDPTRCAEASKSNDVGGVRRCYLRSVCGGNFGEWEAEEVITFNKRICKESSRHVNLYVETYVYHLESVRFSSLSLLLLAAIIKNDNVEPTLLRECNLLPHRKERIKKLLKQLTKSPRHDANATNVSQKVPTEEETVSLDDKMSVVRRLSNEFEPGQDTENHLNEMVQSLVGEILEMNEMDAGGDSDSDSVSESEEGNSIAIPTQPLLPVIDTLSIASPVGQKKYNEQVLTACFRVFLSSRFHSTCIGKVHFALYLLVKYMDPSHVQVGALQKPAPIVCFFVPLYREFQSAAIVRIQNFVSLLDVTTMGMQKKDEDNILLLFSFEDMLHHWKKEKSLNAIEKNVEEMLDRVANGSQHLLFSHFLESEGNDISMEWTFLPQSNLQKLWYDVYIHFLSYELQMKWNWMVGESLEKFAPFDLELVYKPFDQVSPEQVEDLKHQKHEFIPCSGIFTEGASNAQVRMMLAMDEKRMILLKPRASQYEVVISTYLHRVDGRIDHENLSLLHLAMHSKKRIGPAKLPEALKSFNGITEQYASFQLPVWNITLAFNNQEDSFHALELIEHKGKHILNTRLSLLVRLFQAEIQIHEKRMDQLNESEKNEE